MEWALAKNAIDEALNPTPETKLIIHYMSTNLNLSNFLKKKSKVKLYNEGQCYTSLNGREVLNLPSSCR